MHAQVGNLLSSAPRERLAAALNVLCTLAEAPGRPLASPTAFSDRTEGPSGHEPERINRVLSMIDVRFAEPLRLSELCEAANVSERSLTRYFVQHIGESVGRYIARVASDMPAGCSRTRPRPFLSLLPAPDFRTSPISIDSSRR